MFIYTSNIIMFISMVRSKKCKQKKESSKKSSEMIWKMPERISIKKYSKMTRKKYNNVKVVDQYA